MKHALKWLPLLLVLPSVLLAQGSRRAPSTGPVYESLPADTSFNAPQVDRWLARDKALHVSYSFLLTLSTQYVLVNKMGLSEQRAWPLAAGTSLTLGLAKELYDRRRPGGYISYRDLVADLLGISLALLIITR